MKIKIKRDEKGFIIIKLKDYSNLSTRERIKVQEEIYKELNKRK